MSTLLDMPSAFEAIGGIAAFREFYEVTPTDDHKAIRALLNAALSRAGVGVGEPADQWCFTSTVERMADAVLASTLPPEQESEPSPAPSKWDIARAIIAEYQPWRVQARGWM